MVWFMAPIMWSRNVFNSQFLPLSGSSYFDNTGAPYNASAILTDGIFDQAKYERYSPIFMPLVSALTWGAAFALYGAVIVHTFRAFYFFSPAAILIRCAQFGTAMI